MSDVLLAIKNLSIVYSTTDGVVRALNDANLQIRRGEALGLVGETGAGKTTLARGIMRLIPHPPGEIVSGEIIYEGHDLLRLTEKEMRQMRGRQISMIFQDPMTSLNPVMTVGEQILEVIRNHHPGLSRQEAKKQAGDMLEMVGITAGRYDDYPHQFSGGLYVSQPTLTKYLPKLEKELGGKVFRRNGYQYDLTFLGQRYLDTQQVNSLFLIALHLQADFSIPVAHRSILQIKIDIMFHPAIRTNQNDYLDLKNASVSDRYGKIRLKVQGKIGRAHV